MRAIEFITEKWSAKYKSSINCANPKGFSQRAHCAGRKKNEDIDMSMDIAKAIDMLPNSRLKDVIEMRFKYDMTFDEIGRELGVTGSRAREIVAKALRHLRHPKYGLTDSIEENFADGKNPGRKGLAKRSGVNCKQTVSKLRSIAKNSSGERQRMAHWCANMKSGKKK